jgi:hypothetical protein
MKKSFFAGFTGILLTWIVTGVSYSQATSGSPQNGASQQEIIYSVEEKNAEKNVDPLRLNEINSRAARDFVRQYKNVSDAEWFKLKDGFVVHFTNDGIKSRAFYTKQGHYEGLIRSYFEDKLPREIRRLVRRAYYDFSIRHIYEFSFEGMIAYLVKMEDKTSWKTIRIVDGKMDVMNEYQKLNSGRVSYFSSTGLFKRLVGFYV